MIPLTIKKWIQRPLEGLVGRLEHWRQHHQALRTLPDVPQALKNIDERWGLRADTVSDDPVFILSAGWRAGSTLLQRLVMSGNDVLVWGEAYPHCDYIRTLANSLTTFRGGLPPDQFFVKPVGPNGGEKINPDHWIACLYPPPQDLIEAHRQFFRSLFATPATARGYSRWGLKEVVLSVDYATYLKWLFPQARFLFLYRDPYHAYRSYRTFGDWYYQWPDQPAFTARKFGWVWRHLTESFLAGYRQTGGMLLRYEDLVSGTTPLSELSDYLGTTLSPKVLEKRVTGRAPKALEPIPWIELTQLQSEIEPLAERLGYKPPK